MLPGRPLCDEHAALAIEHRRGDDSHLRGHSTLDSAP
jgi:hypothetical protein